MDHYESSDERTEKCIGKTLSLLKLEYETLELQFTDNTALNIWDNGQNCRERRYMNSCDELTYYIGAKFLGMEVSDGPDIPDGESHETQFLIIKTSLGEFTCVTHNEHNGYYGGFSINTELTGIWPPKLEEVV